MSKENSEITKIKESISGYKTAIKTAQKSLDQVAVVKLGTELKKLEARLVFAIAEAEAKAKFIEKRRELRIKYGHVAYIETSAFDDKGDPEIIGAWFKKMNRTTNKAFQDIAKNDPMEAGDLVFNECWIEGDPRIKSIEYLKDDVQANLGTFIGQRISHIKKL